MQLLLLILAVAATFVLASLAAISAYGRFARQARGAPSRALAPTEEATELDRLLARPVAAHPGESGLTLLSDNLDAYAARVLSARLAGRSLDLQYYMWRDDVTGRLLAAEVAAAADRGVRVRLLLDDMNVVGLDPVLLALDAHPNFEVRLFNPSIMRKGGIRRGIELMLRPFRATRRMHNKAWIADGRLAIVGGRNIGDAYFDAAEGSNFRDLDLLLRGAAVEQAAAVFDDFWNSAAVIPIRALGRRRKYGLRNLRRSISRLRNRMVAGPSLDGAIDEPAMRALFAGERATEWTAEARVLSDPPEKSTGGGADRWLMGALQPLLAGAARDLQIVSPYFIPGDDGTRELVGLVARGVRVCVLTNSLAATDVTAVHGAYAPWRRALLEGGVALFELKPYDLRSRVSLFGSSGASLHSKAFTVDGRIGFVGSMNMDPRSRALNTEMGVAFAHEALAAELGALFADETAPSKSYRLGLEAGALVWHDQDGDTPRLLRDEPQASLRRRLAARLIGLLPFHSQL